MVQILGNLHLIRKLVIFVRDEKHRDNGTEETTDIRESLIDFFEGAGNGERQGRFTDIEF